LHEIFIFKQKHIQQRVNPVFLRINYRMKKAKKQKEQSVLSFHVEFNYNVVPRSEKKVATREIPVATFKKQMNPTTYLGFLVFFSL
jgi:hypothetical protein